MNRVSFGESCENTRKYLDSYISNELLVETNHEVLRHLDRCAACAAEVETRMLLRSRLKAAVHSQSAPVELPARVREQLRARQPRGIFGDWFRWPLAAAASVALCVLAFVQLRPERLPAIGDRSAQNVYIQKISSRLAAVLKVGLGDHVHCAVFRKRSPSAPTVEVMEKELGHEFQGLLPAVRASAPQGYNVVMAHHCSYLQRQFVHLTLERDGDLLSLVITRKQPGESFDNLVPYADHGTPVYQASAGNYQVAAFDAGDFFAYVVSDLKGKANLQVASAMAPAVRELLLKLRA